MNDSRTDILNLEWTSQPSRDRHMATLVSNYLRLKGCSVVEGSIFQGYHLLRKHRPRLFFIASSIGADINHEMVKTAHDNSIPIVTLISEGNLWNNASREFISECTWGWNRDRRIYENLRLLWTERSRDITLKHFPEFRSRIKVSGGVGFDIYRIFRFSERPDFLGKYGKSQYRRVIGIGCWDFGQLTPKDHRFPFTLKTYSRETIESMKKDRDLFHGILEEAIRNNPDILFLLKEHPGVLAGRYFSAIDGFETHPNTLILKNEEPVADCIHVSDFWLVYDSTTAMEAWLLGRETALINPQGTDFPRDDVHRGSPNYTSASELQTAIDEFYRSGHLPGFDLKQDNRRNIIKDAIQWDDGLNHVRAGNEIIRILKNSPFPEKPVRISFWPLFNQSLLWNFSPLLRFLKGFRFYYERRRAFRYEDLEQYQKRLMQYQEHYYESLNYSLDQLDRIVSS